jgi:hypothetical protein
MEDDLLDILWAYHIIQKTTTGRTLYASAYGMGSEYNERVSIN